MTTSRLRILAYHRIGEPGAHDGSPSVLSATPEGFERQVEHLAARYRVVSLDRVLEAQRGGPPLPRRAVLITFDDGYRDFGDVAWPVLRRHGLPATVFVPTAFPGDPARGFWWDRLHDAVSRTRRDAWHVRGLGTLPLGSEADRAACLGALQGHVKRLPHEDAMALVRRLQDEAGLDGVRAPSVLPWDALRRLATEGVAFAAHTRTHPALTRLSPTEIRDEVRGSLDDLRRELGSVRPVFCCPFGLFDDRVVEELESQGVELAFSCLDGHNPLPSPDPLRLRRTSVTPRTTPPVFSVRLWTVGAWLDRWRHRNRDDGSGAPDTPGRARPGDDGSGRGERRRPPVPRLAYVMSRFPKLSETFILKEIVALEDAGVPVEIFPLLRERQPVSHPEALRLTKRARFHPFLSLPILRAQAHFLLRSPGAWLGALLEALRGTFGSWNFFVGAVGIFPKSVLFAREMRALGVTHVHAHFCSHPALTALVVHRLTGIPFSFTAHGSDLHVERRMLDVKLRASAFAVTVCDFNREVMVRECGEALRHKVHVVHCGVDTDFFAPRPDEAAGSRPGHDLRIVCVASLELVKGHRFLIEACRLLAERGVGVRCHLVGDGPVRGDLETQIADAGLRGRVRLHGGLPRAAVARLLTRADAAVLASHPTAEGKREGLPVALMEAMATGLPVVASDLSGIPELVEDGTNGLLVPSGDPGAIADALERLAADPALRRRLGEAGRRTVVDDFSLDGNVRGILTLFRRPEAVASPAAAPAGPPALAAR